jgi:hypothetical protein
LRLSSITVGTQQCDRGAGVLSRCRASRRSDIPEGEVELNLRILGAVAEGVTGHASSAAVAVEGLRLLVVGGIGILFPPPAAE